MRNNQNNQNKAIKFWTDCTNDNLAAAKSMFKEGRWSLCMFMCQQTVEALLKGVYILIRRERPRYIHKLPMLLKLTGLKIPRSIDERILRIDAHYIKTRYKQERFNPRIYNKSSAGRLIKDTEEVMQWFSKKLRLKI